MSYDNAEPKTLKTLNSKGQVLNDSGNVISETSDYWKQVYEQSEPKVDKILHSDGTIKDAAGNLIQDTTEFNVKKYNQAEPIPAKYLHADGTIDENPGSGGGADLEDNKEITIDVSTYTEPVEVTPAQGKDGMKKATIILSNIPSDTVSFEYCNYFNDYVLSAGKIVVCNKNGEVVQVSADGVKTIGELLDVGSPCWGTIEINGTYIIVTIIES